MIWGRLRVPGLTSPTAIRFARRGALAVALFAVALAGATLAPAGSRTLVSQRGRAFLPGALTVRQGDTVEIINDDGDLMHHAYIDDAAFSFDSGDQEPGSKADIAFTQAGRFTVLCGIHPKMKLVVTVQP